MPLQESVSVDAGAPEAVLVDAVLEASREFRERVAPPWGVMCRGEAEAIALALGKVSV